MGKKSRLKKERRENPPFRITIGTTMHEFDGEINIATQVKHQSRLIKAALLYADKVTLCGPMISTMLASARSAQFTENQKLELLSLVAPTLSEAPFPLEEFQRLRGISGGIDALMAPTTIASILRASIPPETRAEIEKLKEMNDQVIKFNNELTEVSLRQAKDWGTDQLQDLIARGKVDLKNLGPSISDVEIVAGAVQSAAYIKAVP